MAIFSKFFGRTIGEAAAFALGGAMRSPLEPPLVELTNETWARFVDQGITVPTEPGDAAEIAAERVAEREWAKDQAKQRGVGGEQMDKLIDAVMNAPGVPLLLTLWRRGEISDSAFLHGLRKARLEDRWDAPLSALKIDRLAPAQIALGIVRSVIRDPGLLVVTLDTSDSNVPKYEPLNLDALEEAMASGIDRERLRGMVGEIGLPMPVVRAANAVFRGILTRGAYNQAVLEGDTRPEWGDAIFEEARQIPSPTNFIEGRLRGWLDDAEMNAGTGRHGMTEADTHLLFLIHGRPLVHNQVFIGLLRGGIYDGPVDQIPKPFLKSLQESNLRPEWYNLVWAQRYHYPPFFQTVNLLNKGLVDEATARDWLTKQAYAPDAIDTVITAIGGGTAPKADSRITSAQTKLVTGIEKAYVGGVLDDTAATAQLEQAGLSAKSAAGVLTHWKQLKALEATAAPPAA